MNLFLLISLPVILKIYMYIKHYKQKKIKNTQAKIITIFFAITIFSFLYLIHEFILYKAFEINYKTPISLGNSIFIKEHLYYYVIPLFIFVFFFTLNERSSFKTNSILLIYFAFGLLFSKNLELFILNSKIFGIYEYIELPLLHSIELILSALIIDNGINQYKEKYKNKYKLIFIPIILLEFFIMILKTLILINMNTYALIAFILALAIIIFHKKTNKN